MRASFRTQYHGPPFSGTCAQSFCSNGTCSPLRQTSTYELQNPQNACQANVDTGCAGSLRCGVRRSGCAAETHHKMNCRAAHPLALTDGVEPEATVVAQHRAGVLVDDGARPLAQVLRQELAVAHLRAGTALLLHLVSSVMAADLQLTYVLRRFCPCTEALIPALALSLSLAVSLTLALDCSPKANTRLKFRHAAGGRLRTATDRGCHGCGTLPRKQMPWLSLRPCVASPAAAASRRTVDLVSGPSGNSTRLSCACRQHDAASSQQGSGSGRHSVLGNARSLRDGLQVKPN